MRQCLVLLILLAGCNTRQPEHHTPRPVTVSSLMPSVKRATSERAFKPYVPHDSFPNTLTHQIYSGGEYDVLRFEFYRDFTPNSVGIVISTNLVDWELYDWFDSQPGWNSAEIILPALPPNLFVRACGSMYGEWFDFPVRLK